MNSSFISKHTAVWVLAIYFHKILSRFVQYHKKTLGSSTIYSRQILLGITQTDKVILH